MRAGGEAETLAEYPELDVVTPDTRQLGACICDEFLSAVLLDGGNGAVELIGWHTEAWRLLQQGIDGS